MFKEKRYLFFSLCISFLVGVFIFSFLTDLLQSFFVFVLFTFCFFPFFSLKLYRIFFSFLIGFSLWVFLTYYQYSQIQTTKSLLEPIFVQESVSMTGKILELYKKEEQSHNYLSSMQNEDWKKIYFLVSIPSNLDLERGDIISFRARAYPLSGSENYKNFLYIQNIYFRVYPFSFEREKAEKSSFFLDSVALLRHMFLEKIHSLYPPEEALFLWGILIGARESLGDDLKNHFNLSGLTHIIAVSGTNITLLILFLGSVFSFLPRTPRFIIVSLFVLLFLCIVWISPPVLRAVCMGILSYYILLSWEKTDSFALFAFVLCIFTLFSPLSLIYDISFQLSFAAVLGIIVLSPFFEKVFFFLPKSLALRESMVMTFCALVMTLPIMLINFSYISLVAPISNLLVVWTLSPIMLFGMLSLVVSFFWDFWAYLLSFLTYIFLHYDILLVHFFWSLPGNIFERELGNYKTLFGLLYYMIIAFFLFYFQQKKKI
jgi:competence protein ComEC